MKRSQESIRAGVRRLKGHPPVTADQAADLLGVSVRAVVRWIVSGRGGTFLDGVFDPRRRAWLTTREAVERFRAEYHPRAGVSAGVGDPAA